MNTMKITSETLRKIIAAELAEAKKGKPKTPKPGKHAMKRRPKPGAAEMKAKEKGELTEEAIDGDLHVEMQIQEVISDASTALEYIDELRVALERISASTADDLFQGDKHDYENLQSLHDAIGAIEKAHITLEELGWTVN